VLAAYLVLPPRQTADIAVPVGDATPEQVVTAYLAALDAHDCDTAQTLAPEDGEATRGWCRDLAGLSEVEVGDHRRERPRWSGRSRDEQVAHVPVSFFADWRRFSDRSMEESVVTWGYRLVRGSDDDPWRIVDQGMG